MEQEKQHDIEVQEITDTPDTVQNHRPKLQETVLSDDAELRQYHAALRRYFASGKKTDKSVQLKLSPVLLREYEKRCRTAVDYPAVYDHDSGIVKTVHTVLSDVFERKFTPEDAPLLFSQLPPISQAIKDTFDQNPRPEGFADIVAEALGSEDDIETSESERAVFQEHCTLFQETLQEQRVTLLGFSALTPFHLLNLQLQARAEHNQEFLNRITDVIEGLDQLLLFGHKEAQQEEHSRFDFADKLIAFDKIEDMIPSTEMAAPRLKRIQHCIDILKSAQTNLTQSQCHIYTTKALDKEFALKDILGTATLDADAKSPCSRARAYFESAITDYVKVVAALRMADLEIENQYDEDLHTHYFDTFSILNVNEAELSHFPQLIVIDESNALMHASEDFLALITDNIPVKVFALNRLQDLEIVSSQDGDAIFRHELAALALSHRNAYVFQGAADLPVTLGQGIRDGLAMPSPVLWNLLVPDTQTKDPVGDLVSLHMAIDGRYFPRLIYNINAGERFGSRFDIKINEQAEQQFPSWPLEIETPSGREIETYHITPAAFFALNPKYYNALEIIPSEYKDETLIPLYAYLNTPGDQLIGKIPFIWMIDEQEILYATAIPFTWLRRCRERLDYWQFIQELGGVNSYHVQRAISEAREVWEKDKAEEIEQLTTDLQAEMARARTEDLGIAVNRLVTALLDPESVMTPSASELPPIPVTLRTGPDKKAEITEDASKSTGAEEEKAEVSSEAWIESFLCTSCNDCTDALPAVFKYNDDKQAYVHNPKGGTYAKIVKAAEKCPAKCIHPGLPQNPDEPGLDKLLKRAEKYN